MKLLWQSIMLTIVFTVMTGVIYPLVITGISQVAFHDQANGSLLMRDGKVVGSELLAQQFAGDKYFWPRPSAGSYATVPSGASNLGPTSQALQSNVTANATAFRTGNKLAADAPVPADMVFTSASGLDPHISPEAARLQVGRVDDGGPAEIVPRHVQRAAVGRQSAAARCSTLSWSDRSNMPWRMRKPWPKPGPTCSAAATRPPACSARGSTERPHCPGRSG